MAENLRHPRRGGGGTARERGLAEVATRQHGVVALRQLRALGFGMRGVERRVRDGRLHPIHCEVFAAGHRRLTHRSFWWAGLLAYGDDALLSHGSAASLWGLAPRRAGPVHVTASLGRQGIDRRTGIWIHRGRLDDEDRTTRDGIPVTTVARTLFDFAEVTDRKRLAGAWQEADRLKLLRLAAVEAVCERGRGRRALQPIRQLLASARQMAEGDSPLEDRFLAFCERQRLPMPATNVLVLGDEVDALWPAARLIAELDSWEYHRHRAAFHNDRARDSAHLVAGYRTIRITHHRLDTEPQTLLTELNQLLSVPSPPSSEPE